MIEILLWTVAVGLPLTFAWVELVDAWGTAGGLGEITLAVAASCVTVGLTLFVAWLLWQGLQLWWDGYL